MTEEAPTPKGGWDGEAIRLGCAWWSRLDGRYLVEVQHTSGITLGRPDGLAAEPGVLAVFDREAGLQCIHHEPTTIIEGARFGPDVEDVARWEARVAEVVDARA